MNMYFIIITVAETLHNIISILFWFIGVHLFFRRTHLPKASFLGDDEQGQTKWKSDYSSAKTPFHSLAIIFGESGW